MLLPLVVNIVIYNLTVYQNFHIINSIDFKLLYFFDRLKEPVYCIHLFCVVSIYV